MQVELPYGKRKFVVEVEWSERKRLTITVHPDARIIAKAPTGYGLEEIRKRLQKRVAWIAKQVEYFAQFQPLPPPRQFVSGETHCYMGRQYRLRIKQAQKARVRLIGRFFEVEIPDPADRDKVKKMMLAWYSSHAKKLLGARLALYLPKFKRLGAKEPKLRFRRMEKRWGSCSSNGVILLNTELVKAPLICIDYVVVHELCHLLFAKHSAPFYRLLGKILPDWEKRKEKLEKAWF